MYRLYKRLLRRLLNEYDDCIIENQLIDSVAVHGSNVRSSPSFLRNISIRTPDRGSTLHNMRVFNNFLTDSVNYIKMRYESIETCQVDMTAHCLSILNTIGQLTVLIDWKITGRNYKLMLYFSTKYFSHTIKKDWELKPYDW